MYLEAFSDNPFATNCWLLALEGEEEAVVIDPGTGAYYPDEGIGRVNDDRNSTFAGRNKLVIYGGFAGTETLLSQRNLGGANTSITDRYNHVGRVALGERLWGIFTGGDREAWAAVRAEFRDEDDGEDGTP